MPNDAITPFNLILNRGATSPPERSQRCPPRDSRLLRRGALTPAN